MKRRLIIWLCIFALIAAMTGCNKKNGNKNETDPATVADTGRHGGSEVADQGDTTVDEAYYVENAIKLPDFQENESSIGSISNNNQYELYTEIRSEDRKSSQIFCYTRGESEFTKTHVEWAEAASKELQVLPRAICASADGNTYMIFIKRIDTDGESKLACYLLKESQDGKGYEDITLTEWNKGTSDIPNFIGSCVDLVGVTKSGIMYFREAGKLELQFYDLTAKKILDYGSYRTNGDPVLRENTIYFIDLTDDQIHELNLDTKEDKTIPKPTTNSEFYEQFIQVNDNEIAFLDKSGIKTTKDDGATWNLVVDGNEYTMSVPTYMIASFAATQGPSAAYYVIYASTIEGKGELYASYELSKDNDLANKKVLTICSLYNNTSVREMIANFRIQHPEVRIKYSVLITEENSATKSDIVRTLNTELLAGKGADIILADDLPLSDYIEKGVFMDISDIFNTPGQERPLLSNIANNYTVDGKIYCMPIRILLPYYGMSQDISDQTKTVEDLAAYCKDKPIKLLEPYTYEQLVNLFLPNYANEIFTEDGLIDKEKLSSFLTSLDTIAKQIESSTTMKAAWYSGMSTAGDRLQGIYLGFYDTLLWKDYSMVMTDCMGSTYELQHLVAVLKLINSTYTPMNNCFAPNGIIGINQQTKEPEIAKEFVACLFDEKTQLVDINDGYPVNEKALDNFVKVESYSKQDMYQTQDGQYKEFEDTGLTEKDKQYFDDCIKSLNKPIYTEDSGSTIIREGAIGYLSGNMTLDEAVNQIMQKGNLIFAE